jgi:hypothetical protein
MPLNALRQPAKSAGLFIVCSCVHRYSSPVGHRHGRKIRPLVAPGVKQTASRRIRHATASHHGGHDDDRFGAVGTARVSPPLLGAVLDRHRSATATPQNLRILRQPSDAPSAFSEVSSFAPWVRCVAPSPAAQSLASHPRDGFQDIAGIQAAGRSPAPNGSPDATSQPLAASCLSRKADAYSRSGPSNGD